jgi:hypothetical protein
MSAEPDRRPASCREFREDLTGQSRTASHRPGAAAAAAAAGDVWYMVYKDETGATHTVKGSTEGIRNALQNHLLGDATAILVSRSKTGQFAPLATVPEFRDLVVNPAPLPPTGAARPGLAALLAKASGVVPQAERRRPDPEAVDLGKTPSGTVGQSGNRRVRPGSAGHAALPPEARRTPTSGATRRMPAPPPPQPSDAGEPPFAEPTPGVPVPAPDGLFDGPVDPHADTELYVPTVPGTAPEQPVPAGSADDEPHPARKPFDWTPVPVLLVLVLSAAVGYLLLNR